MKAFAYYSLAEFSSIKYKVRILLNLSIYPHVIHIN